MREPCRKFESLLNEILPTSKEGQSSEPPAVADDNFPVSDSIDVRILMHRDIHFAGNFNLMLEYYHCDEIGVDEEISIDRIFMLAQMERDAKENLAPLVLSGADMEQIARAKKTYEKLKDLCDSDSSESRIPRLIAELVLSEEPEPEDEMRAIIEEGEKIVPTLVDLMLSEDFATPLFPGFGRCPAFAAHCLGQIGSATAVPQLFEVLGHASFDFEEDILAALHRTGAPARDFLLQVVQSETVTKDHATAAFALAHFSDQVEVAKACLTELQKSHIRQNTELAQYLALCCEGLQTDEDRECFRNLREDPSVSKELRDEMDAIVDAWQ